MQKATKPRNRKNHTELIEEKKTIVDFETMQFLLGL
jgi:hypothetical protein